jgi:heterodisulfide reductase subunit B
MELTIGKCPFCTAKIKIDNATVCSGCQNKIYAAKWVSNDGGETVVKYFKTLLEAKGAFMEARKTGKVKYYDYSDGVFRSVS